MSTQQIIYGLDALGPKNSESHSTAFVHIEKPLLSDGPEWLTKGYVETCLQKHFKDAHLKIITIEARPALAKGENYGGVLTRIKAEYCMSDGVKKVGMFIAKTSFEADEAASKLMEPYDIFNREMTIYENFLPKLKALLKEAGETEQIFADTLAVDYDRSALIFEDLNEREFVMPDRLKGLDMNLTKLIVRKLAKMHAVTAVLNEREKGCLEGFDRGMFNRHTNNYADCFVGLLEACGRMVSQWGKDYETYAKKLIALQPVYMEHAKRVFDPIEGHINVLAHGDLWTNNVMVKYDKVNGEPIDAVIIDFQYSAWGSPGIDLFYFFNTSLQEEIHINQQDELIQYYYSVLADMLSRLKYPRKIPSLHEFHLQLEEKAFYAFNATCIIQPVQRLEETEDADINALMSNNERGIRFKNTCFKNPYCQKMIRKLLPLYERRGLLEVEQ